MENAIKNYTQYITNTLPDLTEFDDKRNFLIKNIHKVVFQLERVEIHGFVPVTDEIKLSFVITENIPRNIRNTTGGRVKCNLERINMKEYVRLLDRDKKQVN